MKKIVKLSIFFSLIVIFYFALRISEVLFGFSLPLKVHFVDNFIIEIMTKQCLRQGGEITWIGGFKSRLFCLLNYSDSGKACYSNNDCFSQKCVIGKPDFRTGVILGVDGKTTYQYDYDFVIPEEVLGQCSSNNLDPIWSHECLVGDEPKRKIDMSCSLRGD